jgi:hypothetical protein
MATDFKQYENKKVKLVRNEPGKTEAEEIEGTVLAAQPEMLMVKPKGKTQATLIPTGEIAEIDFASESAKAIARKTLKPVEYGQARSHLLERHGFKLARVNKLSEKEAFELHKEIDHEKEDLGHVHGDKNATERAEAVENAGSES